MRTLWSGLSLLLCFAACEDVSIGAPDMASDALATSDGDVPVGTLVRLAMAAPERKFQQQIAEGTPATVAAASAGDVAALLSITVKSGSSEVFARVWAGGETEPSTSNLNVPANQTRSGFVTSKVNANGEISVGLYGGTAQVSVDVLGVFATRGTLGFVATTPKRVLELTDIPAQGSLDVATGSGEAAALSITVLNPGPVTGQMAVTPFGTAHAAGEFANITFAPQSTLTAQTVVATSEGKVTVHNDSGASVKVLVDLTAEFAVGSTAQFIALPASARLVDTRPDSMIGSVGPLGTSAVTLSMTGGAVPSGALGVAFAGSLVGPSQDTFLSLFPADPFPGITTATGKAAAVESFAGMMGVAADGSLRAQNGAGTAHLIFDLMGYFVQTE